MKSPFFVFQRLLTEKRLSMVGQMDWFLRFDSSELLHVEFGFESHCGGSNVHLYIIARRAAANVE